MTHHCPICGLSVDAEGFPFPVPFMAGPSTPVMCIGHRLQAAHERFQAVRVMVKNGDAVASETQAARPVHNDL